MNGLVYKMTSGRQISKLESPRC